MLFLLRRPDGAPITVPDFFLCSVGSGDSRSGAIGAFSVEELFAVEVADGEMSQVNVAQVPGGGFRGIPGDALAEESQLEPELFAVGGLQIAGVIPPLGLVVGVIEEVARECETVAGERRLKLCERAYG